MGPLIKYTNRLILRVENESKAKQVLDLYLRNRLPFEQYEPTRPASFYTQDYHWSSLHREYIAYTMGTFLRYYIYLKDRPDKIIGVSAQTVAQALQAEAHGADYLGVGAVFPTGSKADAKEVEWDVLREICQAVSIPVVAIGGITQENVTELAGTGICGVAVISAIYAQEDIPAAAKNLKNTVKEMIAPQ